MRKKKPMIIFILILLTGLCVLAFWNQPVVRNYTLETPLIKEHLTILQLSDLHSSIYGHDQKKLLGKIRKLNPDVIVLTGDIVDDIEPETGAYMLIDALALDYPLYYVSGNHEYWATDTQDIFDTLAAKGVILLEDKAVKIKVGDEEIILAGIMDPDRYIRRDDESVVMESLVALDIEAFKAEEEQNIYTILLSHRPELIELYKAYPFDLVLSGHAHGGQIRIPFLLNGLFSPDQGFFPKFAGGEYSYNTMTMIVSRGLSFNIRLPRIFNPPELNVISLVSETIDK